MKKIFVVLLMIICFCVPCLSACSCSDFIATGLIFKLNKDKTAYTVTGLSHYPNVALELKIPEKYEGKPVTAIGAGAFYEIDEIISVEIPDSVTSIGWGAFEYCVDLQKVVLPNKLSKIAPDTFKNCYDLYDITIPSSVKRIEECAFMGCRNIGNLMIPNSVTYIGMDVFESNISNFPYNSNGGVCYYGTAKNPYMVASHATSENKDIEINEKCKVINSDFYWDYRNYLETTTLPEGLQEIGHFAFYSCKKLKSISFPESLKFIGRNAFYQCELLEEVIIPDAVERIYEETFQKCTALKNIVFGSGVKSIYVCAFSYCPNIVTVEFKHKENWYFNPTMYGSDDPELNDSLIKLTSDKFETVEKCTEVFLRYLHYQPQSNTTFQYMRFIVIEAN